ncbi:probable jasmonic acid carboxyl methyltransferase 2 isoform X1 [Salvia miltiorrhiza]|uniref:probable jasmonic acid carboxyl methyltransferase 2 isoform X1 n=1 Tax=Salvia miltiorrhiza TaxID=226208 RepID=UPI0025AD7A06|nr:probable jasmonic acid carboxyl methyltransferase 2 isoform X1 [Salvia miltiorrhiza]
MGELMQIFHMNKGEGEASYAKNCTVQRQIISLGKTVMEKAVYDAVKNSLPKSMGIADLGCSSGPNTLMAISEIIDDVRDTCHEIGLPLPELRVALNDLPGNDFNYVFMSLADFNHNLNNNKGIPSDRCFISAMPGSFYGRLFPINSLHFVHSSSSLHWLSQVPVGLDHNSGKHLNKGKIYISKTSPECVVKAYLRQFEKDMFVFLRSRAAEVVPGGTMVLSFMGRASPLASAEVGTHQWELLAHALMAMAKEEVVEEEKIDSFNTPYYAASAEEVRNVIEEEGSFVMNYIEGLEIGWDGGSVESHHDFEVSSKAQIVTQMIRAVVEPIMESHFGSQVMDDLFRRYTQLLQHYFSKTIAKHVNLVISLTRKF